MQIRSRLTYQFVAIAALIQLLASLLVYVNSAAYRKSSFYEQLKNRAANKTVLLMELDGVEPERLEELQELGAPGLPDELFFVYNFKNELLFSSDKAQRLQIDSLHLDEVRLKEEARFAFDGYELAGVMFADRYNRLVVVIAARDIAGFQQLKNLRRVLIIAFAISLVLLWLLAWAYAGQALRPISRIIGQVDQMSFPLLDRRLVGAEVEDELGRLTATFNNLLDRIEGSLAMQRNFVANASHELRTPLTVIQGQLDVLLLKSRSEAEYKVKIGSVLDDIRNLTNISNRLLMLAQADSEYPARLFGKVAVDDLLWRCQAEIQGRNPKVVIHITLEEELMEAEHLEVQGNEELLKSVVQNLMENAVKYSPAQEAFVSLKSTAKSVLLEVRDAGIGIPEEELEQVFQPFFRSSNVKEIKGHGIGLSLVERIVRLHKGDIKVKSKAGRGTTFSVRLPRGF